MGRFWRLLRDLFGEEPPPRPLGHGPVLRRRGGHGAAGREDEAADEAGQLPDPAGGGFDPAHPHGH